MKTPEDILINGLVFKGEKKEVLKNKVKTKAKKKTYITGQHGSDSAKMKANIRKRRSERKSQRKNNT